MTDLSANALGARACLKVSDGSKTPLPTPATHLLEMADLQDRVTTVFSEFNRRLRWALGASLVSSVILVLQDFGSLFWLTSSSGYVLNAVFFVAIAVGNRRSTIVSVRRPPASWANRMFMTSPPHRASTGGTQGPGRVRGLRRAASSPSQSSHPGRAYGHWPSWRDRTYRTSSAGHRFRSAARSRRTAPTPGRRARSAVRPRFRADCRGSHRSASRRRR